MKSEQSKGRCMNSTFICCVVVVFLIGMVEKCDRMSFFLRIYTQFSTTKAID